MGKKVSKPRKEFVQVRDNRQNQSRHQHVSDDAASGNKMQLDATEQAEVQVTKAQNVAIVNDNHISQSENDDQENPNENISVTQEVPEFVPDTPINDEHTDEELEFIEHDFNAKDDNPNIPKHGGATVRDCTQ
ncbi:hypothetical protein TSUD_192250 [Trifolium subterraneum]|uniref:Uncharacterized protein n=1 Tax=Trifolium subterraneum TaxID=3900 RepID=A0A2Z6PT55_TRISU|nr:hypothetical protein TSUD_192250 [Trifolium subterraneum]